MMGAEISIGHSYVRGGDMPDAAAVDRRPARRRLHHRERPLRIARIYDNESWNPDLRAPLAAPGVDVTVGDYIVAINGVELKAPDNIYRLLDGTANRQTVLTVNARPSMDGARHVTVVPVANEQTLRTRAWVEAQSPARRQAVGWPARVRLSAEHRAARLHELQPLLLFAAGQEGRGHRRALQRRRLGGRLHHRRAAARLRRLLQQRRRRPHPFTSPAAGIWGPKVMIINEMAGSGGDLMPYMFKRRKLGTLVGKRTWGGLVHTADTPTFVDGGSMIAPRGGFFDARRQVGGRERRHRARRRRRELAERRHRRPRSATRTRGDRSAADAERTPGRSADARTAAADDGQTEETLKLDLQIGSTHFSAVAGRDCSRAVPGVI